MSVPRISKEDLKQRIDAGQAPIIVDVRLKYAYAHSTLTLPGARRVAPADVSDAKLPADQDVVLYDSDPHDVVAVQAAGTLRARGLRVMVLAGGLPGWVAANLPTDTKDVPKAPPAPAKA